MRLKRSHSFDSLGTAAPDAPTAPTRGGAALALLTLVALACGALVLVYAEPLLALAGPVPINDQIRLLLALGTTLLVAALSVIVRSSSAARRTKGQAVAPDAAETAQHVDEADRPLDSETPAAPTVLVDVRVLQAQIRALEEALYQQSVAEARLADAESDVDPAAQPEADPELGRGAATLDEEAVREEVTREVLHRVRCTVRGLGVRMDGDPVAADILARVDAAVDRLAATGLFVRPTLSEADHTLPIPTDVPDLPAPTAGATPAAPAPAAAAPPVAPPAPEIPAPVVPAPVAPDEPEVVLPVPAPPPAPEPPRGRRWLRRSTAA